MSTPDRPGVIIDAYEYARLCRRAGLLEQIKGYLATCGTIGVRAALREMLERHGERGDW